MADHIKIHKAGGTWTVRAGGAVIGESRNALILQEGSYPEVVYFPREDLAMAFLDNSDHTSVCPHKGTASYFHIQTKSQTIENAAWSYESPHDGVAQIREHLAFYEDKATVEQV